MIVSDAPPAAFAEWMRTTFSADPQRTWEDHFAGEPHEALDCFIYTMRHLPTLTAGLSDEQAALGLRVIFYNSTH